MRIRNLEKRPLTDAEREILGIGVEEGYKAGAGSERAKALPLIKALEKYANPETHSMDPHGEIWYGDYFDYETAKAALKKYREEP